MIHGLFRKFSTASLCWAYCLAALLAAGCSGGANPPAGGTVQITIGQENFQLELAQTPQSRFEGLSGRDHIDKDGGMLFVFPQPGRLRFVMRRCLVPIDLIFLDPSGRIVALHEMQVEPLNTPETKLKQYGTKWAAQFAIELRRGSIKRLKLALGQKIGLPLESLKKQTR